MWTRFRLLVLLIGSVLLLVTDEAASQDQTKADDASTPREIFDNPWNKHRYELVFKCEPVKWTDAKDAAERLTDPKSGKKGYLATITDWNEQEFLQSKFGAKRYVWVGGKVDGPEDLVWRWVTGPEGKDDGGRGKIFWKGGPATAGGKPYGFSYWIFDDGMGFHGEPNNAHVDEFYLNWNHAADGPGVFGRVGLWNDLNNDSRAVEAFIVEYGE